jgi:hypothetical protein
MVKNFGMRITGDLKKMGVKFASPVEYFLDLDGHEVFLNDHLGQNINIKYNQIIHCAKCGSETKKSFGQGFCYPCFISIPETEECVLRPELCRAHEGIARDMEFARSHCLIDHYVYLAISSGLKVGVTRNTQIPIRWIDQGASSAVILAKTPNRFSAGSIEVALKQVMADKTNWRNMLKNVVEDSYDLSEEKGKAEELLPFDMRDYFSDDDTVWNIHYPVLRFPQKVKSLNLSKTPSYHGILTGIKGQYLIFDDDTVFNIRNNTGYNVTIDIQQ